MIDFNLLNLQCVDDELGVDITHLTPEGIHIVVATMHEDLEHEDTDEIQVARDLGALFAAAPKLLKACKDALNGIPTACVVEREQLEKAIAAVEEALP